jgi:prepilin-type N-terminal cleavage/methylation domain-containing protein
MPHGSTKRSAGFTLVELLISLIVIAILASISMYAYMQILKQAHDDRREDDLIILQEELEKYFDRHQEYPAGCPAMSCADRLLTDNTSSPQPLSASSALSDITSILPGIISPFGDPANSDNTQPLMDISSAAKKYVYYGGTINNLSAAATLSYGPTANFPCTIQSSLAAGETGSYVAGYYSEAQGHWILRGGKSGTPMTVTSGNTSNGCVINKS